MSGVLASAYIQLLRCCVRLIEPTIIGYRLGLVIAIY